MSSQYDSSSRVNTLSYKLDPNYSGGLETARSYGYTYNDADGTITKLTGPGGRLAYYYDNLNRLKYKNTYLLGAGFTAIGAELHAEMGKTWVFGTNLLDFFDKVFGGN